MGITVKVESIGPERAKELLGTQQKNRALAVNRVAKFARQMADGGWQLNGQGLVLDENDHLLDGQHRLRAVMAYGKPVQFLVVRGVARDSFRTMDTGRMRTDADLVYMNNGIESATEARTLAAAARFLWRHERQQSLNSSGAVPGGKVSEPAPYEILDLIKDHPKLYESAKFSAFKRGSVAGWREGPMAFCHYILSRRDKATAGVFFGRMVSGAHLDEGDAILRLRNRMATQGQDMHKLGSVEFIALVFKAWNSFKKNEKIGVLRWKSNEAFPTPA